MRVGKGPHEGRDRNLGPNLRVVVTPDKVRQIKRFVADWNTKGDRRRITFSSAIRRLVRMGMNAGAERPVETIEKVGKRTTIRFDEDLAQRLRAIASTEARDMTIVIDGFLALGLRARDRLELAPGDTQSQAQPRGAKRSAAA